MKTTHANSQGASSPEKRYGPSLARVLTGTLTRHGLLVAASFLMLYPLLWMLASSFKPEAIIFTDLSLIPPSFNFANYTAYNFVRCIVILNRNRFQHVVIVIWYK